jgi:hypothetical protein
MSQQPSRATYVGDRLVAVRREISDRFIEIGQLLLEAYRGNYHRDLGYDTFEGFVLAKLEMSYRKAKYLCDCFDVFIERLGVPRERLTEVGWSKSKELLPVVNRENVNRWLDYAAHHTTSEINLEVRRAQSPPEHRDELQKYSTFSVGVFDDEKVTIEEAIELAKREGQTERPGRALMLICAQYAAEAAARQADALGAAAGLDDELHP